METVIACSWDCSRSQKPGSRPESASYPHAGVALAGKGRVSGQPWTNLAVCIVQFCTGDRDPRLTRLAPALGYRTINPHY